MSIEHETMRGLELFDWVKEVHVSFETAKLLKKAGFPQDVYLTPFYNAYGQNWHYGDADHWVNGYASPSQAQGMRWLREGQQIHVEIRYSIYDKRWSCLLRDMNGELAIPQDSLNYVRNCQDHWVPFQTYEAAAEAGIQAACKYLIEKEAD